MDYKGETKIFSPEEISSMVLIKMRDIAQSYIGADRPVKKAVVTVGKGDGPDVGLRQSKTTWFAGNALWPKGQASGPGITAGMWPCVRIAPRPYCAMVRSAQVPALRCV